MIHASRCVHHPCKETAMGGISGSRSQAKATKQGDDGKARRGVRAPSSTGKDVVGVSQRDDLKVFAVGVDWIVKARDIAAG